MAAAASCSSSNPTLQCKYDVFLSFRGEDTRYNFTSHLYAALHKNAITFIDNDLERGKEISATLLEAIEESKISIIILSENYASSSWCLDELLKILECKNTIGQLVVPVFYRVHPSDVRNQTGSFKKAFAEQERKGKFGKVHKWKDALKYVANLAGHRWEQNRLDSTLVDDIVKDIIKKLNRTCSGDFNCISSGDFNGLIGIHSRIEQILPKLRIGLESACIAVGMWGMGGIGKTTIARAIFTHISCQFDGCCFLENIRERSEKYDGVSLGKELLGEILNDGNVGGTVSLKSKSTYDMLGRKKVLIVLDDVDVSSRLESIIGRIDRFGEGSRIIITTRNQQVLTEVKIYKVLNRVEIYKVEELNCDEAHQFLEAFKQIYHTPEEDFVELSKMVINYAKGVPLALKVLGSSLFCRSKVEWKSALDRLKKTPELEILKVLEISYDGLNPEEKDIFCDIACFFKGWDEDHVKTILDGCGLNSVIGIKGLVEKSLITLSNNILCMHDLLQEMGREIVRKVSNEPGRRSRLWNNEDVYHVLTNETGTEAVEGIFLDLNQISKASLSSTAFKGMCNMRFLKFSDNYDYDYGDYDDDGDDVALSDKLCFPEGLKSLSNKLSYLHWEYCPLESFPPNFHPKNLVELKLPGSKVKRLWEGTRPLFKLKVINLNSCMDLIKISDLSFAPNLEHLNLSHCQSLLEVSDSLGNLSSLKKLGLKYCSNLKEVPDSLCNLSSLRELDLGYCSNLKELPDSLGNLSSLRSLYLRETNIVSIPASIKHLSQLTYLYLDDCKRLQSLPELPSCLTNIWAANCISLQTISFSSIRVTKAEQDPIKMHFSYHNCLKLDQNSRCNIEADAQLKIQLVATISTAQKNHHKRFGPAFRFVYPGSEVPKWFSYKSEGSIVTAQLPWNWGNSKFLGFALSAVVAEEKLGYSSVECKMRTYDGEYCIFRDLHLIRLKSEHIFLWYGSFLELRELFGGNCYHKALFQFHTFGSAVVKKCGVHLLYARDEDECNLPMMQSVHDPIRRFNNFVKGEYRSGNNFVESENNFVESERKRVKRDPIRRFNNFVKGEYRSENNFVESERKSET